MRWLVLLLLVGCANGPEFYPYIGVEMGMPYQVMVADPDGECAEPIISDVFAEVDALYNNWNPESEVSRLNRADADEEILISEEMEEFLELVDQVVQITGGRFDPTVAPLHQLWKEKLELGEVPTEEELAELAPAIGWDKVSFGEGRFVKKDARTALDFCGIAKGYCVDLIVERLIEADFTDIYVSWGGEVRCHGHHPSGRPWRVAIEGSDRVIELVDGAIATSGNTYQTWTTGDGKSYTHICNPLTMRALESQCLQSTTVEAPSCLLADGLATAYFVDRNCL